MPLEEQEAVRWCVEWRRRRGERPSVSAWPTLTLQGEIALMKEFLNHNVITHNVQSFGPWEAFVGILTQ